MTEYTSDYFSDADENTVTRFEEMLRSGSSCFFDVEEIEILCDHYSDKGNYTKARKAVEHGLDLHPGSGALLLKQAHILLMNKQPKKALKILDFLEASEPSNTEMLLFKAVVHRNLSDFEGTKACLLKALETTTENREEIFLDLAFEQEMIEDYEGAIRSLKQSLKINPEHEACLFELGYCFEMAEQVESGADYFKAFLDRYPYSYTAWYNLGLCYEKLGMYELAIDAVDFCLAIKDDFVNGHIMRGNLLTHCDRDAEAVEAYTESLRFDEQNPMVYAAIGECCERLALPLQAEANYVHALAIDNDHVESLMGMGSLREEDNRLTEALGFYRKAVAIDEFNLDNWHIYAETLLKLNRTEDARGVYTEMSEHFADDEECRIALVDLTFADRGANAAVDAVRAYMEQIPQSTDLIWHLIKYLILAGKPLQAEEILCRATAVHAEGLSYLTGIFPEVSMYPNITGHFKAGKTGKAQR